MDNMADVYINYEDSGRTYFRRAMWVNIILILWGVILSIYFMMPFVYLFVLGIIATASMIIYLVHYLIVNKPNGIEAQ
jgi:hypothetical protein